MMIATGYQCDGSKCGAQISHNQLGAWLILLWCGMWKHFHSPQCLVAWLDEEGR